MCLAVYGETKTDETKLLSPSPQKMHCTYKEIISASGFYMFHSLNIYCLHFIDIRSCGKKQLLFSVNKPTYILAKEDLSQ